MVAYHPQTKDKNSAELEPLPQADYSYLRSGFVLRKETSGAVTLVCFGASNQVSRLLYQFLQSGASSGAFQEATVEPRILFDIVLDGLFNDVDQTVWNMNQVYGPYEDVRRPLVDMNPAATCVTYHCPRMY